MAWVWVWESPGGVLIFATEEEAKETVVRMCPEIAVWREEHGAWYGYRSVDDEECVHSVYVERVM